MRIRRSALTLLLITAFLALSLQGAVAGAPAAGLSQAPLELMIAPDSFVTELLPLKVWREQQGLRVDIATTTYIQSQVAGRDLAESVKGFIDQRKAADPKLEFVLLAGDDPTIPGRLLQVANRSAGASVADADRALVSDLYFGATGSTFFNASDLGDEYPLGQPWWGISDDSWNLTATVHVGRIPVDTAVALRAYVARLISWEQSPPAGLWQSRAVFGLAVASVPDGSFASRRLGDDASVTFAAAEGALSAAGRTNISLSDYPNYPAAYDPAADRLDDPTFLGEWGLGAYFVALAARDNPLEGGPGQAYAGDGSSSVFAAIAAPPALDALANGGRLPLYLAAYGGAANFTAANGTDVERCLIASGGGAALAVGLSGRTSAGTAPGGVLGGWTIAADFADEFIARPSAAGVMLDAARARFIADARASLGGAFDANNVSLRTAVAGLTLLGDPASVPLAGPVRTLHATAPTGVAPNASVVLVVTADDAGGPVPNASVAVIDDLGDLQASGATDAQGAAQIALRTGGRGTWTVFVSAAGYARVSLPLALDTPPTVAIITPGANTSLAGRLNFSGVAGDPDPGDAITAVELSINNGPWLAALGNSSWSLEVDTSLFPNGPNAVSARANDGTVWSAPTQVAFNLTNPKPPQPTSPYGAFTMLEDGNATFDLELPLHFAPTGPGAALSAAASSQDRVSVVVNGSRLTLTPAHDFFGNATIELTVFDSYGGSTKVNLTLVVAGVDDPPVLTVAQPASIEEGGTVNFDPRAYDPDGTVPTVYLESGPVGATATGWTAPRGSAGDHEFVIAATDGRFIARVVVVVTVESRNNPPTARIAAPTRAEAGREVSFVAQDASDADGDPISFAWDFADGQTATGDRATHVFAVPGTFVVKLTLFDGRQSVEIPWTITVDPYRPPPAPESSWGAAIGYGSIFVILACAGLAAYQLFFSRKVPPPPSEK